MKYALALIVLASACTKKAPVTPAAAKHDHVFTPEMATFHDTLKPLWHAEAGPQRMADTCGAANTFTTKATSIQTAAAPTGVDATQWTAAAAALSSDVSALGTACTTPDLATFTPAFDKMHTAFHDLMKLMPNQAPHE